VPASRNTFRMDHPIVITFLIIAIVASMSLAAEVLKPLALAILFCFALGPIVRLLERAGIPRVPAVVLTVVTALGTLGLMTVVVGQQLNALANRLPSYEENILRKVKTLSRPNQETAIDRATKVAQDVEKTLDEPKLNENVQDVRVVSQPTYRERLSTAVGPYLETLGVGFLILILVTFILVNREDMNDRIVQLFGRGRITLTTRTMDEVGQRISRFLMTFAAVNSSFGLVIGLGLWAIGLPYAVLWGFLAGALRFIPYAGAAMAFALPFIFSVAHFSTWMQPLLIIALFGVIEVIMNSFLEPMIYGKTTGISALGLLVAAMFWTWLWGGLGLFLSTPLTVCLAVLGKYVPSLSFFATLLGEEAELDPDLRFYQRLLALDQDGAEEIVADASKTLPRAEVYNQILVPALSRTRRDYARGELDDREQAFVWRVVGDLIDDLEGSPDLFLPTTGVDGDAKPTANGPTSAGPVQEAGPARIAKVVGVATGDIGDVLVLRMLGQLLVPSGMMFGILEDPTTPLEVADQIAAREADLVVLSHLPPRGLTRTRYLVRRLRARFGGLPIVVGRWSQQDASSATGPLKDAGASHVVARLDEARDLILGMAKSKVPADQLPEHTPAPAAAVSTAS
jgi:predicted PurR-regulated permease PerM